jgi:hypothetical protein
MADHLHAAGIQAGEAKEGICIIVTLGSGQYHFSIKKITPGAFLFNYY